MSVVWISSLSGVQLWVPAVVFIGPCAYFIAIAVVNRSAFGSIGNDVLRWVAILGACAVMTVVTLYLMFVLAVNLHLAFGGRI
jgi:hypothetical protein